MLAVVEALWNLYGKLWTYRCKQLHDDTDIDSLSIETLDEKNRFYYQNRLTLFDSGDYDRFHMGLTHTHTLSLHPPQKRAWLQTLAYRLIATERARKRLHSMIRPIITYFQAVPPQDDNTT